MKFILTGVGGVIYMQPFSIKLDYLLRREENDLSNLWRKDYSGKRRLLLLHIL